MEFSVLFVLLLVARSWTAPADEPVRVDLPVYDKPEASNLLTQPLEPENYGSYLKTPETPLKINSPTPQVASGTLNVQGGRGWFAEPVTTLEGALLETEGLGSKVVSVKDNLHSVVAGIFQPQPIVDTIQEEEKYGNTGDKFYSAGRAIVGGAQGVSNLINSALEVPGTILRQITRVASEKLNNLGGRLIGL